jgi:hypothetical protein
MNNGANGLAAREPSLVKLYMELTEASEFTARSVFMHVCCWEREDVGLPEENDADTPAREKMVRDSFAPRIIEMRWLSNGVVAPACG